MHQVGWPVEQARQVPQLARVAMTTWSPGLTERTSEPTASTTPAPSWPRTDGDFHGMVPLITDRSLWQTPAAPMATRTSVFTESTIVKEVQAVKISKDVPMTSACLIGCGVLTGVGSVLNRARVQTGETAAVFGVGGVGLNVIQGLRLAGASRIIAVDTLASKEDLARQFGATHFVDASTTDAVAAIREIVPSNPSKVSGALGWFGGVNWSFDCVGHPAVLRNALDVLDWGGNALAIGIPPQGTEVSVDVNALAYVDRGLLGCRYGSSRPHHDIPLMVELYLSGQLMLDELVTETRPLEGFREIVEDMEAGKLARGVLTF